tara:strand:- start:17 stop:412 length:396 start_codon:yes stop_codon:yes gene_type:complete
MTKIAYLNNHLEKYRDKPDIRFDINDLEYLSNYSNLYKEDKKTTKAFIQCFKNKATYKELLNKLPNHVDNLGKYYLITVYWIAYTNYYFFENFHTEMNKMLEDIGEYTILINSPHFCKKVFFYLNSPEIVK